MITSARVIKKSVTATDNSPSQEHYSDLDDQTKGSNVAPGFKPTTKSAVPYYRVYLLKLS